MKSRYFLAAAALTLPFAITYEGKVEFQSSIAHAGTIAKCSGGNRAARKATCLVDGDTGWERGVKWRLSGVDTPEKGRQASCSAERRTAARATRRLQQLMSGGYRLIQTGKKGRYGRILVSIRLKDGRDAGQILIREGLAQRWPNYGNPWC